MATTVHKRVGRLLAAVRAGDPLRAAAATFPLMKLDVEKVLAELCTALDSTIGVRGVPTLVAAARDPLPAGVVELVEAAQRNDLRAMHAWAEGEHLRLFIAMPHIIVSFEAAARRLDGRV